MIRGKDSIKAKASNISKVKKIPNHYIIQSFMFESFLKRLSISKYKHKFIIKGGFLISSIFGIDLRSTMDMDTTIKGLPLNKQTLEKAIKNIINIDVGDNIVMEIIYIKGTRPDDLYSGYKVNILAHLDGMKTNLLIDVTVGDVITYKEVKYSYKTILDNETIEIMAYNYETIIAEKYETIISRNINNTRMKDFYDLYMFVNIKWDEINKKRLIDAINNTFKKRGTFSLINNIEEYIKLIEDDTEIRELWTKYQSTYEYAKSISFENTIIAIKTISEIIIPSKV